MIARARADTADAAIEYRIADLEALALPEEAFDLAYSALAFHYVEDFGRLVRTVQRALVPGAHFVLTIEHPLHMAVATTRWLSDEAGRRTCPFNRSAIQWDRTTDWFA